MRVVIYTLGCKLNQCESEAIAAAFQEEGFSVVPPHEVADLYIINTCTVTSKAEQKARMIRKFAQQGEPTLLITGCYAQLEAEALQELPAVVVISSMINRVFLRYLPI